MKHQRQNAISQRMMKDPSYRQLMVGSRRLQHNPAPEWSCTYVPIPVEPMLRFQQRIEFLIYLACFSRDEWLLPLDEIRACFQIDAVKMYKLW
jgi:hypothetical protein